MANHGSDLPELPYGFEVVWVDCEPTDTSQYSNIQVDKGRRLLSGILYAGAVGHVMFVDDDDLVNRHLVSFVNAHPRENGWYFHQGYLWSEGSPFLYKAHGFHELCGTSHILRSELLNLPSDLESASESYLTRFLGPHIHYKHDLAIAGTPLAPLPFIGAVYRVGHPESTIKTGFVFQKYFCDRNLFHKPWKLPYRLTKLRYKNRLLKKDFFGLI